MPEFSGRGPAREGPACSKADDQRKSESWPQFQGTWACNEAASEAGSLPPLLCRRLLLRASTKTDLGEAGRPKGYTEGPRGNAVVLIETDGPYMCPEPCRGQTAQSSSWGAGQHSHGIAALLIRGPGRAQGGCRGGRWMKSALPVIRRATSESINCTHPLALLNSSSPCRQINQLNRTLRHHQRQILCKHRVIAARQHIIVCFAAIVVKSQQRCSLAIGAPALVMLRRLVGMRFAGNGFVFN